MPLPRGLYTLRFRLAALNLLVFGVIVIALSLITCEVVERFLRHDFDEWLKSVAATMTDEIVVAAGTDAPLTSEDVPGPSLNPFHFPGFYFQLRAADGHVLERSQRLGDATLPLDDGVGAVRESHAPVLQTITGGVAADLLGPGEPMRLLTLYQDREDTSPYYLQVGVSLVRVNESVRRVNHLFILLVPVSVLLVGLVSWVMARRSLAPIGRVALATRRLTIANFDCRIPLPRGRDEVSEMVATINGMLDRLEAGFRAHERFIADAAHELKTPVAVLLAEAQVLARQARTPEQYDAFVGSVEGEMRRLTQIIDSLLILARANAGYPIALAKPVSLNDVVTDAVQHCDALAGHREVRLVPMLYLPGGDDPEPIVKGDEDLLSSMISNLVRNAVRNSPVGSGVEVQLEVQGAQATVAVRDRGPGIPPEFIERIFDEFFRVPGAESHGGAGLGLAIAKGVARLHAGTITVANRADGGCEFLIHLPLSLEDEKPLI